MTPNLAERVVELLDRREPFCLATVIAAGPECALHPGSALLVRANGEVEGSLGDSTIDDAVAAAARAHLDTGSGEFQVWRVDATGALRPHRRAPNDPAPPAGVAEIVLEPMWPPPRLIIVGAGHIAVPLCRFATIAGFEVTVIDDRARFANHERFPDARDIVVDDFSRAIAAQTITPWTYLVLVTRGHEHDEATLRQVIDSPAPYIGMIGSRRRVLLVFERLAALGVPPVLLDRVYAPIGLDIGARTPEEIALAIMAEIVNLRRGGRARSLALRRRDA